MGKSGGRESPTVAVADEASPRDSSVAARAPKIVTQQQPNPDHAKSMVDLVFEEARECAMASRAVETIVSQFDACKVNSVGADPILHADYLQSCKDRIARLTPELTRASKSLTACGPNRVTEDTWFRATRDAAAAGNQQAQLCLVDGKFKLTTPLTADERREYEVQATKYINAGMQRGDWRMAELLHASRRYRTDGMPLPGTVLGSDLPSILELNRLLRLAASDKAYSTRLDYLPASRGPAPSPQDIQQAQHWAERTCQLYFKHSPRLATTPEVCSSPYVVM
ncbi:hypothetical protein [Pseudoxanthomonas indica]|nr:hypothetical protein [Pseudoxanthomonas indica]